MKVKDLKKILNNLHDNMEVEIEVVSEDGDSVSYGIHGHYVDEFYDDETDEDVEYLNLFFDWGQFNENNNG